MTEERNIQTRILPVEIHGRYLLQIPESSAPFSLLVGCHGYAENALDQMKRLQAVDPGGRRLLCSIQALHPFYTRAGGDVVANWMTRLERKRAIEENLHYVEGVLKQVAGEFSLTGEVAFSGFSQGTAMAYRAAVQTPWRPRLISAGGDVPPELDAESLSRLGAVLLARGSRDRRYSEEQLERDRERLVSAGVEVHSFTFRGGHLWTRELSRRAAEFLK